MKRIKLIAAGIAALAIIVGLISVFSPGTMLAFYMRLERGVAGLEEKQIVVGDHTIHYLESGSSDRPAVLLIHGFGGDKDNWTRFARYLTDDYHVVALDLPGFGQSSRIETESYDIQSQAKRVDAFTRAIGLPVHHVAGNSMGGHLSGAYAVRFPDRIKSVGFIDNGGITPPTLSEVRQLIARGENPLIVEKAEDFERLFGFLFVERPWVPTPIMRYLAEQAIKNNKFTAKIWRDLGERPYPLEVVLSEIKAPVLVLWGDHDRILDVSSIEVMRPLLPSAKIVVMKDCGHSPMIERPSETAEHYRSFLEQR